MRRPGRGVEWDRERVLSVLWLVAAALTVVTIFLPYRVELDETTRAVVATVALATGVALWLAPPLPEWVLHGCLVLGVVAIAVCSALGAPDVEGVMFLLPVLYAFATFPPARAVGHLVLASLALLLVLITAEDMRVTAPEVAWLLVTGVATLLSFAVATLVRMREREREAGRRDRRIAEVLQRTLLPQVLPQPAGVTLAARYVPAVREADVGGDFYDAVELPGGRVALAIGDVAGKGLPAAAVVGRVRAALRAYAVEDPEPATVLRRLDELLSMEPDLSHFTTLAYVLVDLPNGTARWAAAAHPPPLLLAADGAARLLESPPTPPLGARAGLRPQEQSLAIGPGDGLLLYTDGLVERRSEPIDVGIERLRHAVEGAAGDAPARLDAALGVVGDARADDVALLTLVVAPVAERLALSIPARPESLAGMRAAVRRWLDGRCPPEVADEVLLACSEAAANAVLHGSASGAQRYQLEAETVDGRIRVRVRDQGRWRDPVRSGPNGRGMAIIEALADRVEVRPDGGGTVVEFERRVGA